MNIKKVDETLQVKVQCNMDVSYIHRLFLTTLMKYEVCIIIIIVKVEMHMTKQVGMVKITVHCFRGVGGGGGGGQPPLDTAPNM